MKLRRVVVRVKATPDQIKKAKSVGVPAHEHNTEITQKPIHTWHNKHGESIGLQCLTDDLKKAGFVLAKVSFVEGNDRPCFRLIYHDERDGKGIELGDHTGLADEALARVYGHLLVFYNEDGSMVIKPTDARDDTAAKARPISDLRMKHIGKFYCEIRSAPQQPVKPHKQALVRKQLTVAPTK